MMDNLTRRTIISISGKALLGIAAYGLCTRVVSADEPQSIDWGYFLELCHELSKSQYSAKWDQVAYTTGVQRIIRQLQANDPKIEECVQLYKDDPSLLPSDYPLSFPDGVPEIFTAHYERQFMVSLLTFEAGEKIPLHNHPNMTGVVFCVSGRVVVDHYDKLEETAENGNLLLRHRHQLDMTRGDSAALTANRGNIHKLNALESTRMIDVFTPPYDNDRLSDQRVYRIDSTPYLDREGIFEVVDSAEPLSS